MLDKLVRQVQAARLGQLAGGIVDLVRDFFGTNGIGQNVLPHQLANYRAAVTYQTPKCARLSCAIVSAEGAPALDSHGVTHNDAAYANDNARGRQGS